MTTSMVGQFLKTRNPVRTATVLAAGRGRRMGALTDDVPKALLEVAGQPLLLGSLQALSAAGVWRVVLVVGYLGERIREAVDRWRCSGRLPDFEDVRFVDQGQPRGTAHALASAASVLDEREPFLVVLGDLAVGTELIRPFLERWVAGDADVIVGVDRQTDPCLGAAVVLDDRGAVKHIVEKPPPGEFPGAWNNSGIYVLPAGSAQRAAKVPLSARGEYELPDLVRGFIEMGLAVFALQVTGRLLHLGSADDLATTIR